MSKPQHTYLRINRITKIRHQAQVTRNSVLHPGASAACKEFSRLLNEAGVDFADIRRAVQKIQLTQTEPAGDREREIKTLVDVLEKLDDLAEQISKRGELSAELGAPAHQFMIKVNGLNLDGVGFTQGVVAVTVFLGLLERAYHKYVAQR